MRYTQLLAASAALLALAGCNNDPVQINTVEADSNAPTTTLNAQDLPPSIIAKRSGVRGSLLPCQFGGIEKISTGLK